MKTTPNPSSPTNLHRNPRRVFRAGVLGAALGAAGLLALPSTASAQPAKGTPPPVPGCPWGGPGVGHGHRGGFGPGHGMGPGMGRRGPGPLMRAPLSVLKKRLGLSAAQVRKVKALRAKDIHRKMLRLRLKTRQIRAEMRAEFLKEQPNLLKLGVLQKKLQAVRNRMSDQRFKVRLQVIRILTPEQRMRARAGVRRFMRHRGRFGRRGGWGRRGNGRRGGWGRGGRGGGGGWGRGR